MPDTSTKKYLNYIESQIITTSGRVKLLSNGLEIEKDATVHPTETSRALSLFLSIIEYPSEMTGSIMVFWPQSPTR